MSLKKSNPKERLIEMRAEIEVLLREAKEATKPVELDQTMVGRLSRMDAMQQQEMALALERRREQELSRIEAALKRLESGDYGFCVQCDEEIAEKRLALNPTITLCVDCAS